MNLRTLARGKPCMVRINGVCNHDPETTVLAHLNGGGMGMKNPDILGAWACSDCHDVYDGRQHWRAVDVPNSEKRALIDQYFREGMERTIRELLKLGLQEAIDGWKHVKD